MEAEHHAQVDRLGRWLCALACETGMARSVVVFEPGSGFWLTIQNYEHPDQCGRPIETTPVVLDLSACIDWIAWTNNDLKHWVMTTWRWPLLAPYFVMQVPFCAVCGEQMIRPLESPIYQRATAKPLPTECRRCRTTILASWWRRVEPPGWTGVHFLGLVGTAAVASVADVDALLWTPKPTIVTPSAGWAVGCPALEPGDTFEIRGAKWIVNDEGEPEPFVGDDEEIGDDEGLIGPAHFPLTSSWVTRETLRVLEQNLVFSKLVNRSYEDRFASDGAKIGYAVNVRKPLRYE